MSILSVQEISKSYKMRKVVRTLSLEIKSGEVVGLLGPNGAGKTTAFYMIVGLIAADSGNILLDGKDLTAKPIIDIMIVVNNILKIHDYDNDMISLGYRPRGECLGAGGTPGRFYYSKDVNGIRTHQAHVMQEGHFDIVQKLNFRDYLRTHPKVAKEYAEIKIRLIEKNTLGIVEYIEDKDKFVKNCIAQAALWIATGQSA